MEAVMNRSVVHLLLAVVLVVLSLYSRASAQGADNSANGSSRQAVVYVMPNAVSSPGTNDNSQVVVDSSHNGKEPQIAKIYEELQHRKECHEFAENMIKDKADYFLLLQHGGGKGNRWAVSNKSGDVIASGESLMLGNSVKDACVAMGKDWQERRASK
jgi:hypothetical protein